MSDRPMLRVLAYDIADDRRRRRVAAVLEAVAVRTQESLFEARLTERTAAALLARLRILLGEGDSLRLYTVPDPALAKSQAIGGPAIAAGARYWLL